MSTSFIGCDPGLSGALAVVRPDGQAAVWDLPVAVTSGAKRDYLPAQMRILLEDILESEGGAANCLVLIEMPFTAGYGSAASAIQQGRGIGILEGLCAALRASYELVAASAWTGKLGLHGKDKGAHVVAAERMFPDCALRGSRGGGKDGRADALLLASYGAQRAAGRWQARNAPVAR